MRNDGVKKKPPSFKGYVAVSGVDCANLRSGRIDMALRMLPVKIVVSEALKAVLTSSTFVRA